MSAVTRDPGFIFIGNLLCLDLLNTEPVREGERVDLLGDFGNLVRWLHQAGALSTAVARAAERRWKGSGEGNAAYRQALTLRAALRIGIERMAAGRTPGEGMVTAVNRVLASRPAFPQVMRTANGFATRVHSAFDSALHLLIPVAESAAWLLEHGHRELIHHCEGPDCVLLFYDTTKNKSRRWCSMEGCGSRAKAAAYYRRTHASK
jgi:predicted RNA-binding Zn ribbon-like protein